MGWMRPSIGEVESGVFGPRAPRSPRRANWSSTIRAVLRLVAVDLVHQPFQRVAQMPLAQVKLGLREGGSHGGVEAAVVVADHARRGVLQSAQEQLPVGLGGLRVGLHAPEL